MNKKGEVGVGTIILLAVALIVGVIFFQTIAQQVGGTTNTVTVNSSQTLAVSGSSIYLTDYKSLSSVVIVNASNQSQVVPATNYTVTNNVVNNGALTVQVTTNDGAWNSSAVYIQGTGEPLTYISNSGGRAVANLILIMFALVLVATALSPFYESKLMEMFGK